MRCLNIFFWLAALLYVLAGCIFNIVYYVKYHQDCVSYVCNYTMVGREDDTNTCYMISVINTSHCVQCLPSPPVNNTPCFTPTGLPLMDVIDFPSYNCPSRLSCFNRSQFMVMTTVDIFGLLGGFVFLGFGGCYIFMYRQQVTYYL